MYFCAISGEPPQDPVVSSKSGQIYERRLILKYIQENGTEPATGDKLEETDLIVLKANPKSSAPRPPSATSIPSLLHTLQNEWDSLMLEFYTLNQQHQATRQELSNALYQQDAATRVIARLIKERDAARDALASVQATTGLSAGQDVDMAEGQPESALPADVMSTIEETNSSLSSLRKKRKPPTDYAKPDAVKSYQSTHKGEITGIDLHPSGKYLAVGSADKTWSLQSVETFQTLFHGAAGNDPYASLALHPDGCLLALGTLSSTIQIYDIRSQTFVASLGPEEVATPFAVNTLSFSENGYHLAAPDGTSSVAIWDLRKQKAATSINLNASATYKINRIRYDPSAQWFGVAGNLDARIIAHKTWEELVRFEEGGEVVDLAFGGLGKEIWGVGGREVRIWGSA
ncbi:hypothetical protein FRB90_001467 [Tulasnella sp. 427]|nr:hypothetical protein FRB90_001467 [Tulasnella sp. 427]